ncbi:mannose-binding protein C-like [Centroberyx gerrardi]
MRLCFLFCVLSLLAPLGHSQLQGPSGPKGDRGFPGLPGAKAAEDQDYLDYLEYLDDLDDLDYLGHLGHLGHKDHLNQDNDSTSSEFEALKNSIAKLELAVNYDFIRKAGQKYFVSYKERNSFSKAAEFCSQRGLELALPQNDEENNILTQFFGTVYKEAWINVNNKKAEGNFETDMKNRPLTFTKWGEGQPDRSIGDTGCTKVSDTGVWQVTKECFINAFIICEL